MSLQECCRLCLKNLSDIQTDEDGHFSLINNRALQRMILECFQIQVSDGEIVSKVCGRCNDEIRFVDKTRKRVRKADFEIKQYYASLLTIKEEVELEEESLGDIQRSMQVELIQADEENEESDDDDDDDDEKDEKPDISTLLEDGESTSYVQKYERIEVEPVFENDDPSSAEDSDDSEEIEPKKQRTRKTAKKVPKQKPIRNNSSDHIFRRVDYKCYICETDFETSDALSGHLGTHVGTAGQKCHLCDAPVTTVRSFNMHLRTVHFRRGKRIPCEECKKNNTVKEFSSEHKLQAHIRQVHEGIVEVEEKKFVCTYCGKAFGRNTSLRMHENIHTKAIAYKCHQCPYSGASKSGLMRHYRIHTAEKPFKCDECDAAFNQTNGLYSHKASKHSNERPFSCEICGETKRFKNKYGLQNHMQKHEKSDPNGLVDGRSTKTTRVQALGTEITIYEPELKCDYCPAIYRMELFLCRHIIEKHPSEQVPMLPCDVCNANSKTVFFLTEYERDRHVANHEKFKSYPDKERECPQCGKTFKNYPAYHHHLQTHQNHECKQCGKNFSTARTLRLHVLSVHLKRKPYKCDKCELSFAQFTTLTTHMKVHQK